MKADPGWEEISSFIATAVDIDSSSYFSVEINVLNWGKGSPASFNLVFFLFSLKLKFLSFLSV